MIWRSDAGASHADPAGVPLGISDELRDGLSRKRWIDHHYIGYANEVCHWRDVADEIVIELVKQRGVDRSRHVDGEQHVAVRDCTNHGFRADVASTTRPVFDHKLLPEPLR